jgi:hypothetical protein
MHAKLQTYAPRLDFRRSLEIRSCIGISSACKFENQSPEGS